MPRTRSHVVLLALIAAAAPCAVQPAAAQNRYDAGSFTIELPRGIELALTNVMEYPASRTELFTGGDPEHGAVMVIHGSNTGTPSDTALRTPPAPSGSCAATAPGFTPPCARPATPPGRYGVSSCGC